MYPIILALNDFLIPGADKSHQISFCQALFNCPRADRTHKISFARPLSFALGQTGHICHSDILSKPSSFAPFICPRADRMLRYIFSRPLSIALGQTGLTKYDIWFPVCPRAIERGLAKDIYCVLSAPGHINMAWQRI